MAITLEQHESRWLIRLEGQVTLSSGAELKGLLLEWLASGKNLELNKGRRIVQEWRTTEWPTGYPPSIVEFSFRAKEGATELTMVHSKVPAEQAESYRQGWIDFYWKPMKQYFQRKMHS